MAVEPSFDGGLPDKRAIALSNNLLPLPAESW